MNRVLISLSFCLALFLVSCSKDQVASGYISVDGEKRLELKCGFEADMSGIGMGKHNWHLFENVVEAGSESKIAQYAVTVWSASSEPRLSSLIFSDIPGYGYLYLEFSGTGTSTVTGRYAEIGGQGKDISGTARVNAFSYNSSSTYLRLDVTFFLDKTIRLVFKGPTPNDGIKWMVD